MPRMVQCVKLGQELPGLEKLPFPGELGQRIYEHVSAEAWELWQSQATLIINHYNLNMADPDARKLLREQMEEFFFAQDNQMPEGWTPPGAKGGAPVGAGSKGGGAPSRKK